MDACAPEVYTGSALERHEKGAGIKIPLLNTALLRLTRSILIDPGEARHNSGR
jgi:hypothetical protein